jgi:tetratricopeptide (TPR) repeat protein
LEQGWQAFSAARLDAALEAWSQALWLDPTLVEALYGTGLVQAQQGNADLAIAQLQAALALQPDYAAARWALYRTYLRKLTLPLIALGLVATLSAGTLVVRRLRRRILRERASRLLAEGRIGESIATYERLMHLDRHDVEVCKALENLYEQEGLEAKRKQVNEIIARLEPDNLQALAYLGKQQFADHRGAEAQQTWERVLRQNPAWAEGYFYLGAVMAERGEVEAAQASFQRALDLALKADHGGAGGETSDTAGVHASHLASLVTMWEGVLTAGVRGERALSCFWEARKALAHRYITQGREDLQRDDAEAAIAHLRRVNILNPADDAARALLKLAQTRLTFERGVRYYQAQEYVDAIRWFRETLALDPDHDKAKRHLRFAQQCLEGGLNERLRHLDFGEREKS